MASTPISEQAKRAPFLPGVYFFKDIRGRILYIGKAANLRNRLRSYFVSSADLSPAKRALLAEAKIIRWQTTANEIEALIEEARLIKARRPRYNVLLRDDKNYFFVGFTNETLPRVFLTHQPRKSIDLQIRRLEKRKQPLYQSVDYIGPFTDGSAIKTALRLLRRIFPYATHPGFPKRCLEHDLGLCPIPPNIEASHIPATLKRDYRKNLRAVKAILSGKRQTLISRLETAMHRAAKRSDFETATLLRDEIHGLERVFAHRSVVAGTDHVLVPSDIPAPIRQRLATVPPIRIEGYDIANLAYGRAATASMVVFINGRSHTALYRQFRIKSVKGANDVAMMREVLTRRLTHPEWPIPEIILIDGGKPQLNAAHNVIRAWSQRTRKKAPVLIGLAKRLEDLYVPERATPLQLSKRSPFLQLLMHVRDEAHRFARRYHFRLRSLDRK